MTESIRRYGIVVAPPGERSQYSNFGFGILDHLVSRQWKMPFEEFLRRYVFRPLGMTRSAIGIPDDLAPWTATRYGSDGVPYPFYDFDHRGGSAVFSSAGDLLRFAMYMAGTRLDDQRELVPERRDDLAGLAHLCRRSSGSRRSRECVCSQRPPRLPPEPSASSWSVPQPMP